MQVTTLLAEAVKSGKITVSENGVDQLVIKASNKKIDINATDKQLIKEVVSSARHAGLEGGAQKTIRRGTGAIRAVRGTLPVVKDIVEDLCKEGVTITLSYKGDRVASVGSEADSKFTRFLTGTRGIEINSPRKLIELGL